MTCDFLCGNLCRSIFVNRAAGYIMGSEKVDPEIKEFLEVEQQKAQLQAQIHQLTEVCWDTCISDRMKDRIDSKSETCLSNCVDRFVDVSLTITSRFQQLLQRNVQQ